MPLEKPHQMQIAVDLHKIDLEIIALFKKMGPAEQQQLIQIGIDIRDRQQKEKGAEL